MISKNPTSRESVYVSYSILRSLVNDIFTTCRHQNSVRQIFMNRMICNKDDKIANVMKYKLILNEITFTIKSWSEYDQ